MYETSVALLQSVRPKVLKVGALEAQIIGEPMDLDNFDNCGGYRTGSEHLQNAKS